MWSTGMRLTSMTRHRYRRWWALVNLHTVAERNRGAWTRTANFIWNCTIYQYAPLHDISIRLFTMSNQLTAKLHLYCLNTQQLPARTSRTPYTPPWTSFGMASGLIAPSLNSCAASGDSPSPPPGTLQRLRSHYRLMYRASSLVLSPTSLSSSRLRHRLRNTASYRMMPELRSSRTSGLRRRTT